jgi:hypothetical protein
VATKSEYGHTESNIFDYPLGEIILPSSGACVNLQNGTAFNMADEQGLKFVGIAKKVEGGVLQVWANARIMFTLTGVQPEWVGREVFAKSNREVVVRADSTNLVRVGTIHAVTDSNHAIIDCQGNSVEINTILLGADLEGPLTASGNLNVLPISVLTPDARKMTGSVYLANPDAPSSTNAADTLDISSGAPSYSAANINDPDIPRNLRVTLADANASITAGTVTVTGHDQRDVEIQEVFDLTNGLIQDGSIIFVCILSIEVSGLVGNGAGDLILFGYQKKLGCPCNGSLFNVTNLTVNKIREIPLAIDQENCSFTPSTNPNGSRAYSVYYEYTHVAFETLAKMIDEQRLQDAEIIADYNLLHDDVDRNRDCINMHTEYLNINKALLP